MLDDVVDRFRHKMMLSGYTLRERELIVQEGKNRYKNVLKQVNDGVRPSYRSASLNKEERAIAKKMKGKTWYGSQFESVLFVQSSPGELLKKEVQKVIDASGFKVRVVERAGVPLKSLLQRSDVEPQLDCLDEHCPVCLTAGTLQDGGRWLQDMLCSMQG